MTKSGKAEKQRDADSRSNRRARIETKAPAAQPGQDHMRPTSSENDRSNCTGHQWRASARGKANELDKPLMRGGQAFGRVVDQSRPRMRKNILEIYSAKSAVVIRFEADVMNDADADGAGDIALDLDASARFHFSAHLEIVFPKCAIDHCSCGGDRLQQDHRLLRQLFQADLSRD